jgi:uncharacterized protein with ATP-grasp and redox domains
MSEPARFPGRIRTDPSNPFAHHTMSVRVPAIVREVLERNPDYEPAVQRAVEALARELESDAELTPLAGAAPGADEFRRALAARAGERWLATDWFMAETYAYRQLIERVRFWSTGRDPFLPNKAEEYAGRSHAEAFEHALSLGGSRDEHLAALFGAALFGNRIDLSFAASRERGLTTAHDDLLTDEREGAVRELIDGDGPLHVIADNAGTELTLDLVLVDFALSALSRPVALHLKVHPTFVSDATQADVERFLGLTARPATSESPAAAACIARLAAAVRSEKLALLPHPFWNGSASLWELPADLGRTLAGAGLVVLKGDANYRRAVGDAVWPADASFRDVTAYFPAPLLALRTLKSDPIVGLTPGRADELTRLDPTWRVNGKRGVASLGGRLVTKTASENT